MPITKRKEDISISYISALCAYADIAYDIIPHDDDSTDGILRKICYIEGNRKFNVQLRIQLKCTSSPSQYTDYGEYLTYKFKAKNYNDLCMEATTPAILGLLVLPEKESEWVSWTSEELLIKGIMYWAEFSSESPTENTGSVTIKINKKHTINSESLLEIMEKIAKEEWP